MVSKLRGTGQYRELRPWRIQAAEGAAVVIVDLRKDRAEEAAHRIGEQAIGIACDVSREADVKACAATAVAKFGSLDGTINNAGLMTFKSLSEWTADDWLKVLRVDLMGGALFTRETFRRVGARGAATVNVASIHALQTSANAAPYSAAKAGMVSLTRTSSTEGKALQIRANAVVPGAMDTAMLWDNPNLKSGAETIDRNDGGAPSDIAAAVAYLASDDARFVSGTTLVVDGGRLAKL